MKTLSQIKKAPGNVHYSKQEQRNSSEKVADACIEAETDVIGRKLADGTYEREFYQQAWIYKNPGNFAKKIGVCYVPELSDSEYTYRDFLELCGGNEQLAEYVFEMVDWQHPESFIDADLPYVGVLPCGKCGYYYDMENYHYCPRCREKREE